MRTDRRAPTFALAVLAVLLTVLVCLVVSSGVSVRAAGPAPVASSTPGARFYNLPMTTLRNPTRLYASPNSLQAIARVDIPAGERLYVMGVNKTHTHLRVVWNTGVGWVPISYTSMNGKRKEVTVLPIFEHEPPACVQYVVTQNSLRSKWKSLKKQEIVIVVDLFRSRYGPFPKSYLSLVVDNQRVDASRREIVERGQFSLKDVVFKLPDQIQSGQVLSYDLQTTSNEPLTFVATIFRVPPDCTWKIK